MPCMMLATTGAVPRAEAPYNRSMPPLTLYCAGKINENLNVLAVVDTCVSINSIS